MPRNINWTDVEVKELISLWAESADSLQSNRQNGSIYCTMAESLRITLCNPDLTAVDVSTKIMTLKKQYRELRASLRSGCSPPRWQFYRFIDNIEGQQESNDESLITESLAQSNSIVPDELEFAGSNVCNVNPHAATSQATISSAPQDTISPVSPTISPTPQATISPSPATISASESTDQIVTAASASPMQSRVNHKRKLAVIAGLSQLAVQQMGIMTLIAANATSINEDYGDSLINLLDELAPVYTKRRSCGSILDQLSAPVYTRRRSCWSKAKPEESWYSTDFDRLSDSEFKTNFRVNRTIFAYLCKKLSPYLKKDETQLRKPISVKKRVAVALFHLGSCDELKVTRDKFGIGLSTACKIVHEFCQTVVDVLMPVHVRFPQNASELQSAAEQFETLHNFPQVIGAIDGCHIRISPPKDKASDYCNFKGWHSINLLAVADAKYKFTFLSCGAPGSNNDSDILRKTSLWEKLESGFFNSCIKNVNNIEMPACLLGDSDFPLSKNLLKPYPETPSITPIQKFYNDKLSSSKMVIENTLDRLEARFRIVKKKMEGNVEYKTKIILACCVLHNICEEFGDDPIVETSRETRESKRSSAGDSVAGSTYRDKIAEIFYKMAHESKFPLEK